MASTARTRVRLPMPPSQAERRSGPGLQSTCTPLPPSSLLQGLPAGGRSSLCEGGWLRASDSAACACTCTFYKGRVNRLRASSSFLHSQSRFACAFEPAPPCLHILTTNLHPPIAAHRRARTHTHTHAQFGTGGGGGGRPWLSRPFIHPHSHLPARRYELASDYSTLLMQYRQERNGCTSRHYVHGNQTELSCGSAAQAAPALACSCPAVPGAAASAQADGCVWQAVHLSSLAPVR